MVNIASGISNNQSIVAMTQAIKDEVMFTPVKNLLVYMYDLTHVDGLPVLAKQLDLLGYNGWVLANTDEEKRNLLQTAIEIHKYKGTVYSIKTAIKSFGFYDITIIEGTGDAVYDGTYVHDGTILYGSGLSGWATFNAIVDIGNSKGISSVQETKIKGVINAYKNARSKLISLSYTATFSEVVDNDDSMELSIYKDGVLVSTKKI